MLTVFSCYQSKATQREIELSQMTQEIFLAESELCFYILSTVLYAGGHSNFPSL